MKRLLEIRTYRLKPGAADAFHDAMQTKAVPMLEAKGMDVVAYGWSDHEEQTYFLVRAYAAAKRSTTSKRSSTAQMSGSPAPAASWSAESRPM